MFPRAWRGNGAMHSLVYGPMIPAILAVQVPTLPEEPTPGWVMAALMGAWMLMSLLEKAGKLPWASTKAPTLTVIEAEKLKEILGDPGKVDQIHRIVSREDVDRPGFYMVWSSAQDRRSFEKMMMSHDKMIHAQINTLSAIQKSLAALHNKIDDLSDRRAG